jgi:hypothetical protein
VLFGQATRSSHTIDLGHLSAADGYTILGEGAEDMSGNAVSAAGDLDGDGLADLVIGAPNGSESAGKTYVLYGGTASARTVDVLGTSQAETLTGTSANESYAAGAGNDTLIGAGGADVMSGGAGDDVFVVNASNVAALQAVMGQGDNTDQLARIDGGGGLDTLRLVDGASLDLTQVANTSMGATKIGSRLASIERIDLATDTGANTLTLAAQDVVDMSGMNLFNSSKGWTGLGASEAVHQLVVDGNAGDALQLPGGNSVWTHASGNATFNGTAYDVYAATGVQLLVNHHIAQPVL